MSGGQYFTMSWQNGVVGLKKDPYYPYYPIVHHVTMYKISESLQVFLIALLQCV
jgi:hypothetical protein